MEHFFKQLNIDLKQYGNGVPQLIIDLSRLNQNIDYVNDQLSRAPHLRCRLVVKSLACISLLKILSQALKTQHFMVFHIPHLNILLEHFDHANLLFGKPMPIQAVKQFYQKQLEQKGNQIHWLIDQIGRLKQYVDLAKQLNLKMKVNIEIDVGLHRGGVRTLAEFKEILDYIDSHSDHVELTGLMGYDAHVTKVPRIFKKAEQAYAESQQTYLAYIQYLKMNYSELWHDQLCLNGGGSHTFEFHTQKSVCNDLSFGSMLLKPSDFDSEYLQKFQPALFIATPVLKVLKSIEMPSMPWFNQIKLLKQQAAFIYGGYWMGKYVYPPKTQPHLLYGRSTNQELVCVSEQVEIQVEDYVFLRPTQSEMVIPQFTYTYLYYSSVPNSNTSQFKFEQWDNFRE